MGGGGDLPPQIKPRLGRVNVGRSILISILPEV